MKNTLVHITFRNSSIFSLLLLLLTGCKEAGPSKKDNTAPQNAVPSPPVRYKKPPASFNNTLVVANISAVFFTPDSVQLDKIKAASQKDSYETEVHNCFFLMRNARAVLKKYYPNVRIIETKTTRYLHFIIKGKTPTYIDLNNLGDMCGVFLFDGKKAPQLADMMNIDTALGFYFGK